MTIERPEFLSDDVFDWAGLGYRIPEPAPFDVLADSTLRDPNPWIVLVAALERGKSGDFSALPLLIDLLKHTESWVLARACAELLGLAGPATLIRQTIDQCDTELRKKEYLYLQVELCYTLSLSGLLWTVPLMTEIYLNSEDRRESKIVTVLLSHLLESEFGAVANATVPDREYQRLIQERFKGLKNRFGSDQVSVLYGELFSVKRLARRLYDDLRSEQISNVMIQRERQRFEASTGIDCSGFYKNRRVQPPEAIAILEKFLESSEIEKYEDGVRYFFGHRIPDQI